MRMPSNILGMIVRRRVRRELAASRLSRDELGFWTDYYSSPEVLVRTRGHLRIVIDYLRNYRFEAGQLDEWNGSVQIFETATDDVIPAIERQRLRHLYRNASVITFDSGGHLGNGVARWAEVADRIEEVCLQV